jgi:uncharacterized damage-inducible protein DinB
MKQTAFLARLEYFKLVHGVTLRVIETFGDGDLDFRPRPTVRSPKELVFHMYSQEKTLAEGAREGRLTMEAAKRSNPEMQPGASEVAELKTVAGLKAYAEACHRAAEEALTAMTEEELNRPVESPFGTYPAWRYFDFAYDEHWHHRGQLYTYLRLLGKEPPGLYDF